MDKNNMKNMKKKHNKFNHPISSVLPTRILKGSQLSDHESKNYIYQLVRQLIPAHDCQALASDLKWRFFFETFPKVKNPKRPRKDFLSRKQRKELNLLKLPKDGWNYDLLEPMRDLWRGYMMKNLSLFNKAPSHMDKSWNNFSVIVAKSEMIGADLKVIRSKVPSLVGATGTVVLETKMTFQLVTPKSKLITVLKETSVFELIINDIKFTFFGKHLTTRPAERSTKKIRNYIQMDL